MKESEEEQSKRTKLQQEQDRLGYEAAKAEAKRNKPMTQAQQRNYMMNYIKHMGIHTLQQLKRYSFDELKELFETIMKNVNTFVPMETKYRGRASELVLRSKRLIKLQSQFKNSQNEEKRNCTRDFTIDDDDWEVYSEDTRRYWRIIRVGNHTEAYQVFADMLKKFNRDDMVKIWDLVKERFSTTEPTDNKEKELWVELKRLFEPDSDDTLWKLQKYMHDPLVWSFMIHVVFTMYLQ
ncbi:hypothetical protein Tco_0218907 [Tanacetum coccineum]